MLTGMSVLTTRHVHMLRDTATAFRLPHKCADGHVRPIIICAFLADMLLFSDRDIRTRCSYSALNPEGKAYPIFIPPDNCFNPFRTLPVHQDLYQKRCSTSLLFIHLANRAAFGVTTSPETVWVTTPPTAIGKFQRAQLERSPTHHHGIGRLLVS